MNESSFFKKKEITLLDVYKDKYENLRKLDYNDTPAILESLT